MKKVFKKLALIIVISAVLGILLELAMAGYQYQRAGQWKGETSLETASVVTNAEDPTQVDITVDIPQGLYVNKLVYYYSAWNDFTAKLSIYAKNGYGQYKKITVTDDSVGILDRSVVNIHKNVSQVTLTVSGAGDVAIGGFAVDNSFKPNPIRAVFIAAIIYLALFLLLFREQYKNHIEWAFLNIALVLGVLFIITQPLLCSGWDEHIHFRSCYEMASYGVPQDKLPYSAQYMFQYQENTKCRIGSIEENYDLARVLDFYQDKYDTMRIFPKDITNIRSVGYVFQALFLKLGMLLHFKFAILWIFGKFANVLLYSVVVFFAIRKTPVAKVLMCFVGLLPTAVYLSASYTYDVTVTAFLMLAAAIIIKAYYGPERNFTLKEQILFIAAALIASAPKVVYIPFVIMAFFLPTNRYAKRKTAIIYRCALVVSAVALMGAMVLPSLTGSAASGDPRGGNTSSTSQIRLMKQYPMTYLKILAKSVFGNICSYMYHFNSFAHLGEAPQPLIVPLGMLFVWFTDRYKTDGVSDKRGMTVKLRILSLLVCFIITCLIWTALYTQFTSVGSFTINGVQPRYFLPILWILLLSLQVPKVPIHFNKTIYQCAVLMGCSAYLLSAVYFSILSIHNL